MRVLYAVLSLCFLSFAAVQFNDPDPVEWMVLYGGVAALAAVAALEYQGHPLYRPAVWLWILWAVVWAGLISPHVVEWFRMGAPSIVGKMEAQTPYVEYVRECFGLLLAAGTCAFLLRRRY